MHIEAKIAKKNWNFETQIAKMLTIVSKKAKLVFV
jgi:hypothetical protein